MRDAEQAPGPTPAHHIRAVGRADVAALKAVVDRSGLFPSSLLDDMLAGYLDGQAQGDAWLTVDDEGPVAVAYYAPERMTQGTWNLQLIAVDPARRSQGVGAALLAHIERALTAEGQRVLLVETSGTPDFERTRAFYRANGYDEEARIRDFYEAGDDKVVFWKSLTGGAGAA